ncbi:MAG: hypothetical protein ACJAWV_001471 [Flammeovirgaceae bacterium]|jgi:hypothetical protein
MNDISSNPHLPVDVLLGNILNTFLSLNHEVDFKNAISKGLSKKITLHQSDLKISDVAELDFDNRINVHNNFCQFYWCICYTSILFFDKGILEKLHTEKFRNHIKLDNEELKEAYEVFLAGIGLLDNDKPLTVRSKFFELPNPFNNVNNEYVGFANAIYSYGMTFILFHEYSHFTLNHVESNVNNEKNADSSAYWTMVCDIDDKEEKTAILGILTALTALIFLDSTLIGGQTHPDGDDRILDVLQNLDSEYDNYWGIVCILIKMWAFEYNLDENFPIVTESDTWKEYSEILFSHLKTIKKTE